MTIEILPVVHLHDVGVVIIAHDDNLVEQQLPPLLLPKIHPFHRHLFQTGPLRCDANNPSASFADLYEVLQVVPWVPCRHDHL